MQVGSVRGWWFGLLWRGCQHPGKEPKEIEEALCRRKLKKRGTLVLEILSIVSTTESDKFKIV